LFYFIIAEAKITAFHATNDGQVKEGSPVNITCQAKGNPTPSVMIFKDGLSINGGTGKTVRKIGRATMEDMGEYFCVASNDEHTASKRSLKLTVKGE
jgi:hypothetical protein